MNEKKRDRLRTAVKYLNMSSNIIDGVIDDEQSAFDNLPEGIQESERGVIMEESIEELEEANECISDTVDMISKVISN